MAFPLAIGGVALAWLGRAFATRIGLGAAAAGTGYLTGKISQRSKLEEWVGFDISPTNILLVGGGLFLLILAVNQAKKLLK